MLINQRGKVEKNEPAWRAHRERGGGTRIDTKNATRQS